MQSTVIQYQQEALLSVPILELQNIPFENDCNRQMTLKVICLRS